MRVDGYRVGLRPEAVERFLVVEEFQGSVIGGPDGSLGGMVLDGVEQFRLVGKGGRDSGGRSSEVGRE